MIKRRFYKVELADQDDASDSSSSSDSESEAEPQQDETEEEEVEVEAVEEAKEDEPVCFPSSGSGYESEDSSANEVDVDSAGLLIDDDEDVTGNGRQSDSLLSSKGTVETGETQSNNTPEKDSIPSDLADRILKCKSVFKCRLCPRIVCLTEETLRAHLESKRHARSEKLLQEGRLKLMLNSDGEIEEEQETHAERHARTVALAQDPINPKKKNRGRQRQRSRKKVKDHSNKRKKTKQSTNPTKKKRKNED